MALFAAVAAGDRPAAGQKGAEPNQWAHTGVASGLYFVKLRITYVSGATKEFLQKVVIIP